MRRGTEDEHDNYHSDGLESEEFRSLLMGEARRRVSMGLQIDNTPSDPMKLN